VGPDDPFPTRLPVAPVHGSAYAPLDDILSWHSEVCRGDREYAGATVSKEEYASRIEAADAAAAAAIAHAKAIREQAAIVDARVADADRRRRHALNTYYRLVDGNGAVVRPPGMEDSESEVSVEVGAGGSGEGDEFGVWEEPADGGEGEGGAMDES
jgi:hypothetical protein